MEACQRNPGSPGCRGLLLVWVGMFCSRFCRFSLRSRASSASRSCFRYCVSPWLVQWQWGDASTHGMCPLPNQRR